MRLYAIPYKHNNYVLRIPEFEQREEKEVPYSKKQKRSLDT